MTVAEDVKYLEADIRRWAEAIASTGISAQQATQSFNAIAEFLREMDDVEPDETHGMTLAELLEDIDRVLADVRSTVPR